ncbi:conjugal transfer protein TraB [Rosenbergiella australiborealis]|uniref:Conjugal transfer protein TraB n=1 Tax=Rosenbergiella australiborealis TaxID=1544696 RepID=A0ABS5T821_9GAMM|nr:TraB/GumN family protein [Rosenbergiella australiborealis]MBT0728479.1 conjugal transfer protein TraB [Rosenbergiella australiborealis]
MTKYSWLKQFRRWLTPKNQWSSLTCPTGERQFVLVGSIHMGVPAMSPLSSGLIKTLAECDGLVVEADITHPLDYTPELNEQSSTVQEQLTAEQWQRFMTICQECHLPHSTLAQYPAWQIGLTLQQKQAYLLGLHPEFGIDHQLLTLAHRTNQSVIALESPQQQLELLTTLPDNGLSLLIDSLTHWRSNARQLQKMIDWWLSKSQTPQDPLPNLSLSFGHDLQQTFIIERNQQWAKQLLSLPRGKYLVAVGALHLTGPSSLIDLLSDTSHREYL